MSNILVAIDVGAVHGVVLIGAVAALAISYRLLAFPDLTIEGSFVLGPATFAACIRGGSSVAAAVLFGIIAAAAAGILTAVLHVRLRLNKFLAGIITVAISYSLSLRVLGASNVGLFDTFSGWSVIERVDSLTAPYQVASAALCAALAATAVGAAIRVLRSKWGIRMRIVGCNPDHAAALGLPVAASTVATLALTNAFVGATGVVLAARQGFVDVGMGGGLLIIALASMVIGERVVPDTPFTLPTFVVLAAAAGSVLYQIVIALSIQVGVAPTDLKLATAVLLILVVAARRGEQDELLFR